MLPPLAGFALQQPIPSEVLIERRQFLHPVQSKITPKIYQQKNGRRYGRLCPRAVRGSIKNQQWIEILSDMLSELRLFGGNRAATKIPSDNHNLLYDTIIDVTNGGGGLLFVRGSGK